MPTGADTTVYHSLQLELARLGLSPKHAYYYFPTEKLGWEISPNLQKMHTITFLPRSWDGKFPLKYGVPRFPVSGIFVKLLRVSVVLTFITLTHKIHHGGVSCFGITKINYSQSVASHLLCMRLKKYLRLQQFTNFCNLKQTEF